MMFKILKLFNIAIEPIFVIPLIRGAAAGVEHISVLNSLGLCHCVIDIGANRGQFSLAVRRVFPNAQIHAFEPLREPADILERVFAKDNLMAFHPHAIGPERADVTIHVSHDDDSSSLLPIGDAQIRQFPRTAEKEVRKASVIPLRDVLDRDAILAPALLKIDVQGYELEALRGCEPLLGRFRHAYIECSFIELYEGQALASEIIAYLENRGFGLVGIYNMSYDRQGQAIQGDFLFSIGEQVQIS